MVDEVEGYGQGRPLCVENIVTMDDSGDKERAVVLLSERHGLDTYPGQDGSRIISSSTVFATVVSSFL